MILEVLECIQELPAVVADELSIKDDAFLELRAINYVLTRLVGLVVVQILENVEICIRVEVYICICIRVKI